MLSRCRFADPVQMQSRSSQPAKPAAGTTKVAHAMPAAVRLLPASHALSGRPDPAYAGAGR